MTRRLTRCLVMLLTVGASAPVLADATNPCTSLTPDAIQATIDKMNEALSYAETEANTYGWVTDSTGTHLNTSDVAVEGRDALISGRDYMVSLQNWLTTNDLGTPYVTNNTAAYNVQGGLDAAHYTYLASLWLGISAVRHRSNDGLQAADLANDATLLLTTLGTNGNRCYTFGYFDYWARNP